MTSRPTVLLVDDERTNRSVMCLALADRFDIHPAKNGQEALQLAERTRFDVLITDHRMPGMSGLELARKFRELHPHTHRIVVTGFTQTRELSDALAEGLVRVVLPKPVLADDLAVAISSVLEGRE